VKEDYNIYRLLSGLDDVFRERKCRSARDTIVPSPPVTEITGDGTGEFLRAMEGVRPIVHAVTRIPWGNREVRQDPPRRPPAPTMSDVISEDYIINVVNLPEYMEGSIDGVSPLTLERLRNEEFSVQATLDLHGFSVPEGEEAFRDFIKQATVDQLHCIKVIHGRGLKSKEGPVLKKRLKVWIIRAMNRKWVVAFCSSKMCHGGPGATLILLRKNARKTKLNIMG
jgi:DNA-nicking Smr family endonuclease